MVDIPLILGIAIIIVAIVTLVRIIKQLVEGLVIIGLIFLGSALIFHSAPIIGIPHFNMPINPGPNIVGANAGNGNTTDVAIFNAYAMNLGDFSAKLNGKPVAILNDQEVISPAKIGILVLNASSSGSISLSGQSQLFGFNVGSLTARYNYTK